MIQPVRLVEGGDYLSHFGRFEIEGISLEVMGDSQRREGDRWVSTMAKTQRVINLDGVNVVVSSLEEETLAYIRRGRMDRAAQCLAICDPDQMKNILRREIVIGVL